MEICKVFQYSLLVFVSMSASRWFACVPEGAQLALLFLLAVVRVGVARRGARTSQHVCPARVGVIFRSTMGVLFVLVLISNELGAVESTVVPSQNLTACPFPFPLFMANVEKVECTESLHGSNGMVQCMTFLFEQTRRPSHACCAAVRNTWSDHPECLCKVAFFLPGNDVFTAHTGPKLLKICDLQSVHLCESCPPLLNLTAPAPAQAPILPEAAPAQTRLLPEASPALPSSGADNILVSQKSLRVRMLVRDTLVCFSVLVVIVVAVIVTWKKWQLYLQSLPDRDEIRKIEAWNLGKPTMYAYNVLRTATNGFHIDNKIGEGGFGAVYKGILQDGSEVAVKKLSSRSRQGKEEFLNEVMLITRVQHKNLVKIRGCCVQGRERLLVYEYVENKSVQQALLSGNGNLLHLDWKSRINILSGTASGLSYLHEGSPVPIIHRDIKSSNILLDRNLLPKIADFGLARLFFEGESHVSTGIAGTIGYLAPEYAIRGQLSEKVDIFSFGIVALELVSGRNHFVPSLPPERAYLLDWTWTLHAAGAGNLLTILDPSLVEDASPEDVIRVIEVALLCTQLVASLRPSMAQVVQMLAGEMQVEARNAVKPTFFALESAGNTSAESPQQNQASRPANASAITILMPR